MDIVSLLHVVFGWSAYLSAAAAILTFVTGILFFSVGQPFGKINDISSVIQVLLMIPLVIFFFQILPTHLRDLGMINVLFGLSGIFISAFGQSLLILGRIDFQGSLKFFPAGAAIGIWLMLSCSFAVGSGQLPQLLGLIGILAGMGYIVTVIGFLWGSKQNVVFYIGALMLGVSYPVWAIWLGGLILSGMSGISAG